MDRELYFQRLNSLVSPLLKYPNFIKKIGQIRTNELREPIDLYLEFADLLAESGESSSKTRGQFIRFQCGGIDSEEFFEVHRESWGIPKFEEDLVTVEDFKNGFLWKFRDHSTSWNEDGEARNWFFHHVEARFVRHYEFWACDNGPKEIVFSNNGDYKTIMWRLVKIYQDYSALASPIFSNKELAEFYNNFDEDEGDYLKEDLLEIIETNPNWKP